MSILYIYSWLSTIFCIKSLSEPEGEGICAPPAYVAEKSANRLSPSFMRTPPRSREAESSAHGLALAAGADPFIIFGSETFPAARHRTYHVALGCA
jgi:hypothetical protein